MCLIFFFFFFLAQLVSQCNTKLYLCIFLSNVHDKAAIQIESCECNESLLLCCWFLLFLFQSLVPAFVEKDWFSNPVRFLLALLQPDFLELGRKSMFTLNTSLLAGRESDRKQRTGLCRVLPKRTGFGPGFCFARSGVSEQKLRPLRWATRSDGGVLCPAPRRWHLRAHRNIYKDARLGSFG